MFYRLLIHAIVIVICAMPYWSYAQEEQRQIYVQGTRYLELNIASKEKLNERVQPQQQKLLKKLARKEKKLANRLKSKDSAAYQRYQAQPLSFDSISKRTPTVATSLHKDKSIDSLRRIQQFIRDKATNAESKSPFPTDYSQRLDAIQAGNLQQQETGRLIESRVSFLKSLKRNSKHKSLPGLKGIEKQSFYGKGKIQAFERISEEPQKLEEQALEYLQGQEGFSDYLKEKNPMEGASLEELEKMGYQTKRTMMAAMQKKFGNSLPDVQKRVGSQVQEFQDKAKDIKAIAGKAKNAKHQAGSYKRQFKAINYKNINKPSFKINPMRALPLSERLEKQFNWQTSRPTPEGAPAQMQIAAMIGYRHTPKITYGIGIAPVIGLGQGWTELKLTLEGIGLRSYLNWQWQYGLGLYGGYERTYRQAAFFEDREAENNTGQQPGVGYNHPNNYNSHNNRIYSEAVLIGITKTYRINDKWKGSVQLLYDIWWKDKALNSPIQLRFSTIKQ